MSKVFNSFLPTHFLEEDVWHGSGSDFKKFDVSFMGTGEGAQAHGWGLYFAENYDTAKGYRNRSSINDSVMYNDIIYKRDTIANKILNLLYYGSTKEEVKETLEKVFSNEKFRLKYPKYDKVKERLFNYIDKVDTSKIKFTGGQLYRVELPELYYFLDEQKNFSNQPNYVQEKIKEIDAQLQFPNPESKTFNNVEEAKEFYNECMRKYEEQSNGYERFRPKILDNHDKTITITYHNNYDTTSLFVEFNKNPNGSDIYRALTRFFKSKKDASLFLYKFGIKGITYDGREDGRCFVLFNGDDAKILSKEIDYKENSIVSEYFNTTEAIENFSFETGMNKSKVDIKVDENDIPISISGYMSLDYIIKYGYGDNSDVSKDSFEAIVSGNSYDLFEHSEEDSRYDETDFYLFNEKLKENNIPLTFKDLESCHEGEENETSLDDDLVQEMAYNMFDGDENVGWAYAEAWTIGSEAEAINDCRKQLIEYYPFLQKEFSWNEDDELSIKAEISMEDINGYYLYRKQHTDEDNSFFNYYCDKNHDIYDALFVAEEPYYGWSDFDKETWDRAQEEWADMVIELYNDSVEKE